MLQQGVDQTFGIRIVPDDDGDIDVPREPRLRPDRDRKSSDQCAGAFHIRQVAEDPSK